MNITNDLVTEYLKGFFSPLTEELEALRKEAEEEKVPIILRETESFLTFLLETQRPASILEIGTAVGYSAMVFARYANRVVTIEKDDKMAQIARNNIKKAGLQCRIQVLCGDGEEVIKSQVEGTFDMVFIDAAKSHYKRFLESALPYCHEGTIIISDNVLLKGATASDQFDPKGRFKTNIKNMRQYLEYISNHPRLDTCVIACGDGLALSRCK